jgi:parallel beta-helix repeat protein
MRFVYVLLAGALAALLLAGVSASPAFATHVKCGDTITTNTTLDSDLTNCPNNGIVIGADNITLDLNGHTIDGVVSKTFDCEVGPQGPSGEGIQDDAGYDGVTIKGGTVQQFADGVRSFSQSETVAMSDSRLHHLTLRDNRDQGIFIGGANGPPNNNNRIDHNLILRNRNVCDFGFGIAVHAAFNQIDHNRVEGSVDGIIACCDGNDRNVIEDNSVSHNPGYAFILVASDNSRVEHNVLNGNEHGILLDGSSGNDIRRNSISHSAGSSIDLVGGAAGNRVERNRLTDDGDGVTMDTGAHGNEISRNTITGTGLLTDQTESGGFGIIVDGADDNTVQRNSVIGGRGEAILVTSFDPHVTADRNLVSRNVANSKLSDGILVNNGATGTLIERNTANRSGDDGIDVDAAGTKLTRNTANRNHDLGIEAVHGVIDGGGNKASGNGNPTSQCTNVVCA